LPNLAVQDEWETDKSEAGKQSTPKSIALEAALARRLTMVPRPRAGDWLGDEIAPWRAEGIDLMLSLLEI
jgi:hypothetical protein